METINPIDAEIRAWLKLHVENAKQLSIAAGHSGSWLHKYMNGDGQATIDDLVRLAALMLGMNLPVLTEDEQKLLKACRAVGAPEVQDVVSYVEYRRKLALRGGSKESSALEIQTPPERVRRVRGKR